MKNFFPSRPVSCPVLFCCCSFNLKVKPYNKSFIGQACSVKIPRYWPSSFFFFFAFFGQYPGILTEQAWSITHIYSSEPPYVYLLITPVCMYVIITHLFRAGPVQARSRFDPVCTLYIFTASTYDVGTPKMLR